MAIIRVSAGQSVAVPPKIEFGSLTDVGIRRSHNQDAQAVILAKSPESWAVQGHVFLVADGMGGHAVGEKASAKAAQDIPLTYLKHAADGISDALRRAFVETNAGIHAIGQKNPEFRGLGTTATALILRPEGAWIAHVGDCRVYRVRNGLIQQLTFDHSYVWEMARRQGCSPEEIQGVKTNVIIRSLGPDPLVEVDIEGPHPVDPGDVFVMCSDGLCRTVSDPEIGAVASLLPPAEACQMLVQFANLRGGPDNITVQVVSVGEEPHLPVKRVPLWHKLMQKRSWGLASLTFGVLLTILSVMLSFDYRSLAIFGFFVAVLLNLTGVIGLLLHYREEKLREENEPPPPNINIYREESCQIDHEIVDKLAQAMTGLEHRVRETDAALIPPSMHPHVAKGRQFFADQKWDDAFREYCRAMHELARSYNKTRNKPEMFQPFWERFPTAPLA